MPMHTSSGARGSRSVLPMIACIVVLLATSLGPLSLTGWVRGFSEPTEFIIGPASGVIRRAGGWVVSALNTRDPGELTLDRFEALETERDVAWGRYSRERAENDRLRTQLEILQQAPVAAGKLRVRPVLRPVVGVTNGALGRVFTIRAGEADGLTPGAVVTAGPLQLLGRITEVRRVTSRAVPITDTRSGSLIRGSIFMTPDGAARLAVALRPTGDGRLVGDVEVPDQPDHPAASRTLTPGLLVRLDDDAWPADARLELVLGVVEEVTASAEQPLRPRVIVTPGLTLDNPISLSQISEVVVRIPQLDDLRTETDTNEDGDAP